MFHSFNEYYIYLVVHVPWGGRNAITESKESERRFIMLGQDGGPLDNIWGSLALDYYAIVLWPAPLHLQPEKLIDNLLRSSAFLAFTLTMDGLPDVGR